MAAFVFDAYGTLFRVHPPMDRLEQAIPKKADVFLDYWRNDLLSKTWLYSLSGIWKNFDDITHESLAHCFDFFNIKSEALYNELISIYLSPTLFEDVRAYLPHLSANNQLLILSNGTPEMLMNAMQLCKIDNYIDNALSAQQTQVYKTHPNIYQLAVDHLNIPKAEINFVSSNSWDIFGATSFGFKTIWLNRNQKPFNFNLKPGKVIQSFNEILS